MAQTEVGDARLGCLHSGEKARLVLVHTDGDERIDQSGDADESSRASMCLQVPRVFNAKSAHEQKFSNRLGPRIATRYFLALADFTT